MVGRESVMDEILVLECQSGSVQALEALVSRWQKRLWRHAYCLTGDAEGAWDVTQESWLGIIRGIGRLGDPRVSRLGVSNRHLQGERLAPPAQESAAAG